MLLLQFSECSCESLISWQLESLALRAEFFSFLQPFFHYRNDRSEIRLRVGNGDAVVHNEGGMHQNTGTDDLVAKCLVFFMIRRNGRTIIDWFHVSEICLKFTTYPHYPCLNGNFPSCHFKLHC